MSKASRARQDMSRKQACNNERKEWRPGMALTCKTTKKTFYLYLPDEAIYILGNRPDGWAIVNHGIEKMTADSDSADFAVLKWTETPYGTLTGVLSRNARQFAS
jgi:hypothetical protein